MLNFISDAKQSVQFLERKKTKQIYFVQQQEEKKYLCVNVAKIYRYQKKNKKKKISASVDFCLSCCLKGKLKKILIVAKKNQENNQKKYTKFYEYLVLFLNVLNKIHAFIYVSLECALRNMIHLHEAWTFS